MENFSKGVMVLEDSKKWVMYRVACDCGDSDHDLTLDIEYDDGFVVVNIYGKVLWSAYFGGHGFFRRQWEKIKACFKIIFKGYIEMEEGLLLRNEEHINNVARALLEGRKQVAKFNEENQIKE